MVEFQHVRQRSFDKHVLVRKDRDAVADRVQAVEVMGDHEHRQPERVP
jgi:hypothetical protein